MLLDTGYKKLQELYSNYLHEIGGIKFTFKEVNIIACLLHNRGNKKIAYLLSISPKTVESHIHNIMLKLGNNSREYIIDLVEKSAKLHLIKQYYLHLLVQASFYSQLRKIGKVLNRKGFVCLLHSGGINKQEENLLKHLQTHLKIANITLINIEDSDQNTKEAKRNLYVSSKELVDNYQLPESIFLVLDKNAAPYEINHIRSIDFRREENYYLSVLELLKQILNETNLDKIIQEFNTEYNAILDNVEDKSIKSKSYHRNLLTTYVSQLFKEKPSNRKLIILLTFFSGFILFISWIIIIQRNVVSDRTTNQQAVRASFSLPHESMRLERSSIIAEINNKLKYQGDIKTVALIGIGGAGKTTVARQYAREQKANIVWEINAETEESLIASFEQLAYAASQSTEERNELREIQKIENLDKSRKKLILFVRKQLKSHAPWFLVYDNVQNFLEIQAYFPYDPTAWGSGAVILTTRNNNIANNSYIGKNKGVFFGELKASEQFLLFTKILGTQNREFDTHLQKEQIQFLQHIPPFPLDVSTAASYIKATGISYKEYLKRKDRRSEEFALVQSEIIKENNTYNKNRYGIITLSLKHIIDKHPDFAALLLFISLLDSQEILRDLLDLYKGEIVVDSFLHNLQQYSMIIEKDSIYQQNTVFSLHRSTQTIILKYLTKVVNLEKESQLIDSIVEILEEYLEKISETAVEVQLKHFLPHLVAFLDKKLVSEITEAYLNSKLGYFYWAIYRDYKEAINLIEQSLPVLSKYYKAAHPKKAWALGQLGVIYKNSGDIKKGKNYLEESLAVYKSYYGTENHIKIAWILTPLASIYRKIDPKKAQDYLEGALLIYKDFYGENDIKTAEVLAHLGRFHRNMGHYVKAKDLLEQAVLIHDSSSVKKPIEYAWLTINLGIVNRNLGDNEKARRLFEHGLSINEKTLGKEHIDVGWSRIHLGIIYGNQGNLVMAKQLIQKSIEQYKQHYGQDHPKTAWASEKLGVIYRESKEYTKANDMFNQSFNIYKEHYGIDSVQVAFLMHNMGEMKFMEGNLKEAEEYLNKSFEIFKNKNHPEIYRVLDSLIELYLRKSIEENNQKNADQEQFYHNKALHFLSELQKILKINFPEDSPYVKKINLKYSQIMKENI